MHIIGVELLGYGLNNVNDLSKAKLEENCLTVYLYITQWLGINESDVVLVGN